MTIIFLRTATNGVQFSLYVVYLDGIGLTGTMIGALFSGVEIMSGLGSLFAGQAMRLGDPQRTMLTGTVAAIVLIRVTPFLGGIHALLLAQAGRGWLQRVVQPMMFSVQTKAVGKYRQGRGARAAPDDEPARLDRDPAADGRDRRSAECDRELRDPRRGIVAVVHPDRPLHPAERALGDRRRGAGTNLIRCMLGSPKGPTTMPDGPRYDDDFYAWTQYQAEVLRTMRTRDNRFDREHVAEEVEDLGKSERAAVRSEVRRIIEHLLKLAHSPATDPRSDWRVSIINARAELDERLTPSLPRETEAALPRIYAHARDAAAEALDRCSERAAAAALPQTCPYTLDQILAVGWYPDNGATGGGDH